MAPPVFAAPILAERAAPLKAFGSAGRGCHDEERSVRGDHAFVVRTHVLE
jgi:hypothetical protein